MPGKIPTSEGANPGGRNGGAGRPPSAMLRARRRKEQPMRISSPGSTVAHSTDPQAAVVAAEHPVAIAGRLLVRYGLVVVVAWIGALKYGSYEAAAIQPLISHSLLMSWLYHIFSVGALAAVAGGYMGIRLLNVQRVFRSHMAQTACAPLYVVAHGCHAPHFSVCQRL